MPQSRAFFAPLKRTPKRRKIAAFDTEGTGSRTGFVCGSVVGPSGNYFFTDRYRMLEHLLSPEFRGVWLFAHNLEYDLSVLTGGDLLQFSCLFAGDRLLWAEKADDHSHSWKFMDSSNLFVGNSVKELGIMIGKAKWDLHSTLQDFCKRGGCFETLQVADQKQLRSYNMRDAEIVYEAVEILQDELLSLGGELKPTLAGCSMDLFRRKYLKYPWPTPDPAVNQLARDAYYGARTEPYRLGRVNGVNGYDVSSLYPSIMAKEQYPNPQYLTLDVCPPVTSSLLKHPGVTSATVIIPDCDPPPLPTRVNKHLFFGTGEITGSWTNNELAYALEHGVKIKEVHWRIFSPGKFSPFEQFINEMYRQRKLHSSSNDIREHLFKLILNSSYGRFGLSAEGGLQRLVPLSAKTEWADVVGGELRFIGDWPYALVPVATDEQPAYTNVFIAAQVSAGARLKMHKFITDHLDHLCYTDTDSLWITGEMETKDGLGEMRLQHEARDLWIVAPKEYAVFSGEHLIEAHAKGIPEAYRLTYLRDGKAVFPRPTGLREASLSSSLPGEWALRLRQKRYSLPKRAIVQPEEAEPQYFLTRPWSLSELRELQ